MSSLLPFLVVLPLVAAAVSVALARAPKVQRTVAVITIGATVVLALIVLVSVDRDGPLRMNLGGWPGRIAITMVADRLATVMLVLGAVMLLVVLVYALGQSGEGARSPWYVPAYLVLAAGISAAFLAGDLFNLFVAFEILLAASYVLITLEGDDDADAVRADGRKIAKLEVLGEQVVHGVGSPAMGWGVVIIQGSRVQRTAEVEVHDIGIGQDVAQQAPATELDGKAVARPGDIRLVAEGVREGSDDPAVQADGTLGLR